MSMTMSYATRCALFWSEVARHDDEFRVNDP
jgi:hypothetical protein